MFTKLFISLYLFFVSFSFGFDWDPVTNEDWNFKIPDSINIKHAAILFEKINIDDSRLFTKGSEYSLYKRIRIFSEEGRKYADVQVPILASDYEIEEIKGRVILNDSTIIELNDDHVFTKYVFESDENEVEQTFFYLPGVTSDCIIEYYIEYTLKTTFPNWIIEKDIYLKDAQLSWKFYRGGGMANELYDILMKDFLTPNFVILNKTKEVKFDKVYDDEIVEQLLFSVNNIAPFIAEDYMFNPDALKGQVIIFYQNSKEADSYWVWESRDETDELRKERANTKLIKEITNVVPDSVSAEKKIEIVADWIWNNITNTDYVNDDKEYKNDSLNCVIKNRFGDSEEINKLFFQVMFKLELDAYPVYCIPRTNGIFRTSIKFRQFSHQITAISFTSKQFKFYDLSDKNLPLGRIKNEYEGTKAFIVGYPMLTEISLPYSSDDENTSIKFESVVIESDKTVRGNIKIKQSGLVSLKTLDEIDQLKKKGKNISELFEDDTSILSVDSLNLVKKDSKGILLEGGLQYCTSVIDEGSFITFTPFENIAENEKLSNINSRNFPFQFDYAYSEKFSKQIEIPQNLKVFTLPADLVVKNKVGDCYLSITKVSNTLLSATYSFVLKKSFIDKKDFPDLNNLIVTRKFAKNSKIIFEKNVNSQNH